MNKSVLQKSLCAGAIVASTLAAQAQTHDGSCHQPFRQISVTTAHTITSLICHIHANNMTEKLARTAFNGKNFVHQWTIEQTEDSFEIQATCSRGLQYLSQNQAVPSVSHPGYSLKLSLPRFDDKCSPLYKGTLTELRAANNDPDASAENSWFDKLVSAAGDLIKPTGVRTIAVQMYDTGFRDTRTGEFHGGRALQQIQIGTGVSSMWNSGYSNAGLSQGSLGSNDNQLGFGNGRVMTQADFFYGSSPLSAIPQFSLIKADFQLNKSADPSLANRDSVRIHGSQRELVIQQTGVTRSFDDEQMLDTNKGGASAFFVKNVDLPNQSALVYGCTDYSYTGDDNLSGRMTPSDCRTLIQKAGPF